MTRLELLRVVVVVRTNKSATEVDFVLGEFVEDETIAELMARVRAYVADRVDD